MNLPERWTGQGTWDIVKRWLKLAFVRTNLEKEQILYAGTVLGNGTLNVGTGGFTVKRIEVGGYQITLDKPISPIAMVAVDVQATQRTACAAFLSTTVFAVVMSNGTGAKEDIAFSFFILGVPL